MRTSTGFYRRSLVIGSGFFTVALIEPLYSAYVPLMLSDHLKSSLAVGAVLSMLNLIAPLVIPFFSALSDRTITPIGRRMPYIVVFLPLAALALAFVPIGAKIHVLALTAALAAMNFFRHAARGPVVSLMPDLVPAHQRSQANGVINMMGGMAAITATVVLAPLITVQLNLPWLGLTGRILPFWIIAVLIVASTVFLYFNVREPMAARKDTTESTDTESTDTASTDTESKDSELTHSRSTEGRLDYTLVKTLRQVASQGRSGALPILAAVMLWFTGWKLVTPFITIYARDYLGAGEAAAGLSFGMLAISQTIAAVPSGLIAARIGRRRTIRHALALLSVIGAAIFINHHLVDSVPGAGLYVFWGLLFCLGLSWATLITNCLPLLWDLGGSASIGLFTGLYYFASQTALVAGPAIGGAIVQFTGFGGLFLGFSAVMVLARFFLNAYRQPPGDPQPFSPDR